MTSVCEIIIEKADIMRGKGLLSEARSILEDLIETTPGDAKVLSRLGQICGQQLDHAASIGYLEASHKADPNLLDAHFTLGVEYQMTGRCREALSEFDRLITILPEFPPFHRYRGLALQELGREPEAVLAFEEALRHDSFYTEAMGSLANLLMKHYHFDHAEKLMRDALAIKPELTATQNDLGRLFQLQGRSIEAVEQFRRALELEPDNRLALSNVLYGLCYLDTSTPEKIASEHFSSCSRLFPVQNCGKNLSALHKPPGSLIRIGYISNDFCLHSVAFFLEPILLNHDHGRFQIFCYSNKNAPDDTTRRLMELNVVWRDIFGVSADEVAACIAADGIDILVDLSGHTSRNRLDVCALKPAPVMATWLGYPHSTGMRQFDYYISDAICDPPGMTDHLYCEQVWRLPGPFCCYLPPTEFPAISSPPHENSGRITFASFNNMAKVNDTTIKLWSAILQQVPESSLLIKSASLGGKSARRYLFERFAEFGIPEERIILKVHAPTPLEHLEQYNQVDIALDTYPYHGTTTTCESLWMGVPVVTLAGRSHTSRVGASFLTHVGLPELVASSPEEYVDIAVKLANDKVRLNTLRTTLRSMMARSSLMDAAGVTKAVETAYRGMFDRFYRHSGQEMT